jgi:putative ABC transport system ATP-binding protein
MTSGALSVAGLVVRYGDVVALHDVTLTVQPGRLVAVTGASGAGKSSLLWSMAGALQPAEGTVHLGDVLVTGRGQAAELGVRIIPQGNGLASVLTAAENVLVPLLAAGLDPADASRRTTEALAAMGLEESGRHLVEELSGGQQQRVAIARALASDAGVVLADEPTSDLDATTRQLVLDALRRTVADGGIVVMATHDPEAAGVADAEVHLDAGRLQVVRR